MTSVIEQLNRKMSGYFKLETSDPTRYIDENGDRIELVRPDVAKSFAAGFIASEEANVNLSEYVTIRVEGYVYYVLSQGNDDDDDDSIVELVKNIK